MTNEREVDIDRSTVGMLLGRFGAALVPIGLALARFAWRHPLDSFGLVAAGAASVAIVVNALFLQASPHPAPMLPAKARPVAAGRPSTGAPSPAVAPALHDAGDAEATARPRTQVISDIQRQLARRGFFDGPVDGVYGARTDAAIRDFEQAAGQKTNTQPDEALLRAIIRTPVPPPASATPPATTAAVPLPRPASAARTTTPPKASTSSKRVVAVQRALAEFGYGQVKATGIFGPETKSAIERFERERKLPVTGQISERLARELAAVTGRPLD